MKKHIGSILTVAAILYAANAISQTINLRKLPKAEREKYLIELSVEVVMTYGPDFYEGIAPTITEKTFHAEDSRTIITKNNGRRYYEVAFPYDSKNELVKTFKAAVVEIWCDTGEPLGVALDGYGYAFFDQPYIRAKTRTAPDPHRPQIKRTYYPPKE